MRRDARGECGGGLGHRAKLVATRGTRAKVRVDRRTLVRRQAVQRVRAQLRDGLFVSPWARHVRTSGSLSGASRSRSLFIARRIRVLMVPNGWPVFSAISDWLSPRK